MQNDDSIWMAFPRWMRIMIWVVIIAPMIGFILLLLWAMFPGLFTLSTPMAILIGAWMIKKK